MPPPVSIRQKRSRFSSPLPKHIAKLRTARLLPYEYIAYFVKSQMTDFALWLRRLDEEVRSTVLEALPKEQRKDLSIAMRVSAEHDDVFGRQ